MSEDGHVHSMESASTFEVPQDKTNETSRTTKSAASSMQTMFEKSKAFLIPFGTPVNVMLRDARLVPDTNDEQKQEQRPNDQSNESRDQNSSSYPWLAWLGDETILCPIQGMAESNGNEKWRHMYGIAENFENDQEAKHSSDQKGHQQHQDSFNSLAPENTDLSSSIEADSFHTKSAIGVRQPTLYSNNSSDKNRQDRISFDISDSVTNPSPSLSYEQSSEEASIRKPILRLENPDLIEESDISSKYLPSHWWSALFCCCKDS